MKKILAIYHKDCIDGATSAGVLLKKFPDAKLFPLGHSYTPEDMEPIFDALDAETEIYTLDCGLGVTELLEKGYSVTTLDHHISEKESLTALAKEHEEFTYVFDNEKSGASLAWTYFFPEEAMPELIKYVEDIDLWLGKYGEESKFVGNYLFMFRNEPSRMLELVEGDIKKVLSTGRIIAMAMDREIEKQVTIPPVTLKIGEHKVLAYNITIHESACGNILSGEQNQAVALFTIKGEDVKFSFRGKEGQSPSALDLATELGGGGHVCSAGASIPLKTFLGMIV